MTSYNERNSKYDEPELKTNQQFSCNHNCNYLLINCAARK